MAYFKCLSMSFTSKNKCEVGVNLGWSSVTLLLIMVVDLNCSTPSFF